MESTQLVDVLRQALQSERDGYQFYTMAAAHTDIAGAKEIFEHLGEEERKHFDALQKEYRNLLEGRAWDGAYVWGEPWNPEDATVLFSDQFKSRIQGRHHEMAALSIGILLEKEAFQFYAEQSRIAEGAELKAFFDELAAWERGHHAMLLKLDEILKDAYWDENRFAPLL